MAKKRNHPMRFKHQIPRAYERVFGRPAAPGTSPTKQLEVITSTAEELKAKQAEQALLAWMAQ